LLGKWTNHHRIEQSNAYVNQYELKCSGRTSYESKMTGIKGASKYCLQNDINEVRKVFMWLTGYKRQKSSSKRSLVEKGIHPSAASTFKKIYLAATRKEVSILLVLM